MKSATLNRETVKILEDLYGGVSTRTIHALAQTAKNIFKDNINPKLPPLRLPEDIFVDIEVSKDSDYCDFEKALMDYDHENFLEEVLSGPVGLVIETRLLSGSDKSYFWGITVLDFIRLAKKKTSGPLAEFLLEGVSHSLMDDEEYISQIAVVRLANQLNSKKYFNHLRKKIFDHLGYTYKEIDIKLTEFLGDLELRGQSKSEFFNLIRSARSRLKKIESLKKRLKEVQPKWL